MLTIRIVGYPRSGNILLARLLGEALAAPVYGPLAGVRASLASDVVGEAGSPYSIIQAHVWLDEEGRTRMPNDGAPIAIQADEKIVMVLRDPRDVAVSALYYFEMADIEEAVSRVGRQGGLFYDGFPSWQDYTNRWVSSTTHEGYLAFYEFLCSKPWTVEAEIAGLLSRMDLPVDESRINAAVKTHAFAAKRAAVDDGHPFGRTAQLRHLRSGRTGDWRYEFTAQAAEWANMMWWDELQLYGWETNPDWWREVK